PPRPNTSSALAEYYTTKIYINRKMIQPRFGFALAIGSKSVLRGGYGLFYGLTSNSTFYATRVENGVYQQQYVASVGTFATDASGQPAPGTYPSYAPTFPN